ncbi:uncharacterized protein LOC135119620 [Zophobas morio]|uniref:uncharacterized protein LOC135119620 n=1 Tax=Zophobas morio TaxID=2755281 RepID=UPI003082EB66
MECGDIDLAQLLKRQSLHALSENHIRLYWQQMLEAVQVIHNHRIVHGDLKPANFLFVEGRLKLIDFGIAKTIREDHTSAYRDSQAIVGTLNYMSPEAIQGTEIHSLNPNEPSKTCVKLGPSSDIWSLGCILYAMVYGKTPFQHITMPIKKMQAIIDDQYEIKFPDIYNEFLLDVLHNCLKRKPTERLTIRQLLQHPFLHPSASQKNIFLRTPKNDKQLKDVVKRYLLSQSHTPRTAEKISQDLIKKLHEPSI